MDPARALFANDTFYLAFSEGDADAVRALWAQRHSITCIHPGWPALTDREEVLDSWTSILSNPDTPKVSAHHARAFPAEATVLVICYEAIGDQMLVATNVFVEEDGEARLVHHQAGPCARPPEPEEQELVQ